MSDSDDLCASTSSMNVKSNKRSGSADMMDMALNEKKCKSIAGEQETDNGNKGISKRSTNYILSETDVVYIPLNELQELLGQISKENSNEYSYQKIAWFALETTIKVLIKKLTTNNIALIAHELLAENIHRGKGFLCSELIETQANSTSLTNTCATLVAVCNSKFPRIGAMLLHQLVVGFKRSLQRNDKNKCMSTTQFIASLTNLRVAHERLALDILTMLLNLATEDAIEVATQFLRECGKQLLETSATEVDSIEATLQMKLLKAEMNVEMQNKITAALAMMRTGFKSHIYVAEVLRVNESDQSTHSLTINEISDLEDAFGKPS